MGFDDFDKRFEEQRRTIQAGIRTARYIGIEFAAFWLLVIAAVLSFVGWAIVMTMRHFGIV